MADVAVIFHWPPSELYPMSLTDRVRRRNLPAKTLGR
ncbi:GpE family phage tail protein [Escherichia coli]